MTDPKWRDRFRVTSLGVFLYFRFITWSFIWVYDWVWTPQLMRGRHFDGFSFRWGWFAMNRIVWPQDDPWGLRTSAFVRRLVDNAINETMKAMEPEFDLGGEG